MHLLNDQVLPLEKLLGLRTSDQQLIRQICRSRNAEERIPLAETLIFSLFEKTFSIDQSFRAQLNYILDRKGIVKISDLLVEFGVSKVTLRKYFINKMGLPPKQVSRIWRMNYFLQLQKEQPGKNLTEICLEAGFYDQAHFIKEFRSFFGTQPLQFFRHDSQLIKVSQETIVRRFSNLYDPREE